MDTIKRLRIDGRYIVIRAAVLLLFYAHFSLNAEVIKATSPNQRIEFEVLNGEQAKYRVTFDGKPVIAESTLGLIFKDHHSIGQGFRITSHETKTVNDPWEQPWGEFRVANNHYNQLMVRFVHKENSERGFAVEVRVFDDGLGFRYHVFKQPGPEQINIIDELTEFTISEHQQAQAWWIPARGWNRYEYLYRNTDFDDIDRVHTPFTLRTANNHFVSIHEAALTDYAAMVLEQRRPGTMEANLTPWSDGIKVKKDDAFETPWRTIQIADSAIGLLNSPLILNLNEPNKLGNVDWVEPGKYVGIWWEMHINKSTWGSGEKHGATTENTKKYMDFAAKYGFDGVLVEGWNLGWDGNWFFNGDLFNFTKAYSDFDIKAVSNYGSNKGVRLIGHHETSGSVTHYKKQMNDAYDMYQKLGVTQVKTGYVADGGDIKRIDDNGLVKKEWHDGQFMVNEYLRSVMEAAKRGISINTHEPIKDTGLRRTYPNWITREGARGQEFNAWGQPPNSPEHTTILPFTRMLAGPMDFTPGIFDVTPRGKDAESRVNTTIAKQLALYVVLYSPIQMAADLPENYLKYPDAFQFIQDVATDWEQSVALAGDIGEYIVMARQQRDSNTWFVGGITDEQSRVVTVDFSFLPKNKSYSAQIYQDAPDSNYQSKPDTVKVTKIKVTSDTLMPIKMATSGGFAIKLDLNE